MLCQPRAWVATRGVAAREPNCQPLTSLIGWLVATHPPYLADSASLPSSVPLVRNALSCRFSTDGNSYLSDRC